MARLFFFLFVCLFSLSLSLSVSLPVYSSLSNFLSVCLFMCVCLSLSLSLLLSLYRLVFYYLSISLCLLLSVCLSLSLSITLSFLSLALFVSRYFHLFVSISHYFIFHRGQQLFTENDTCVLQKLPQRKVGLSTNKVIKMFSFTFFLTCGPNWTQVCSHE